MINYKFKLVLGDWSSDGHGISEDYIIESNVPVEKVREAYFKACDITHFNFAEKVCAEYEDCHISKELREELEYIGIYPNDYIEGEYSIEDDVVESNVYIQLFFDFIKIGNKNINLKIIPDDLETFHFWGRDSKERHIPHLGYGLFTM